MGRTERVPSRGKSPCCDVGWNPPYAESTVSSIFATFSTILNAAVRARIIPASPCSGIRVTSGEYAPERLVASPVQALRAATRLYEAGLGLGGFTLCLADFYTGARWGELAGQQRHEYDELKKTIGIQAPLKEVGGVVKKYGKAVAESETVVPAPPSRRRRGAAARRGRTKTPAGTRWVQLPPGIAVFYDHVTDVMRKQVLDALESRWEASLLARTATERARLTGWFPHLGPVMARLMIENQDGKKDAVPHLAPKQD